MDRNPDDTALKIGGAALSRLAAELEGGQNQGLTTYLAALSRFRKQSWSNVLLLTAQRPDATRVAGFHTWNDLGRTVKKGEKGIVIFASVATNEKAASSQAPSIDDPFPRVGFRATYVFDVSQTAGKPLPEGAPTTGHPAEFGERLKALLAGRGVEPNNGRSIAAAVRYVVYRGLGLEPHAPTESIPLYTGDQQALARSLARIQETSAQILDELLPEARAFVDRLAASVPQRPFQLDARGFDKIHREYGDRLVRNLTGFVRDRDKAEDIAARAFQTAWEKREKFRGESLPSTWIQAIARNEARRSFSREPAGRFDSIDRPEARELATPELVTDELERRDDRLRLHTVLAQLPVKQRRALSAHFIEGLSIREIAQREQVPLGTVLSRISSGKQLLREAWDAPRPKPQDEATRRGSLSPETRPGKSQAPERGDERRVESLDLGPDR